MLVRTLIVVLAALTLAPASATAGFDHRPVRAWSFTEIRRGLGDVRVDHGVHQGGRLFESHEFGSAAFDHLTSPAVAEGEVRSTASGNTFSVLTQSPSGRAFGTALGSRTRLEQDQSYTKGEDQASLRFRITRALISAIDANGTGLSPLECPDPTLCVPMRGTLRFEASAFTSDEVFFQTGGVVTMFGHQADWQLEAATYHDSTSPLWDGQAFVLDPHHGDFAGTHGFVKQKGDFVIDIPLASLSVGRLFGVQVTLEAEAIDYRGRESTVEAYLQDPRTGELIETSGLRPRGEPPFAPPPTLPLPAAECSAGPDPNSGTLQLGEPAYTVYESDSQGPFVFVERTGGSTGAASATLTTRADSAVAGLDYTEVSTTVRFEDGDTSPRLVQIPVAGDEESEAHESFSVSLADASCAPLGSQTDAAVTIVDDDSEPEPQESFTIGGTVSGLEGSGLVLANLGAPLAIAADGPFEFSPPVADGMPYEVTVGTQPSAPDQVCTVSDGSGTIAGADVTDIDVDCVTPPPASDLDSSFGGDGRVSTPGTGPAQAVAIQPDGMIVTAGGGDEFVLTRHEPDGDLDPTFGDGGIVTTDVGHLDEAHDVAIDGHGRIVAVGTSDGDFAVVRYEPDGEVDPTFGTVLTDFNGLADIANSVVLQPDGKIVVAGHAQPGAIFQNDFALVRYEEDGDVDLEITTDLGTGSDLANAVALDAQGRIVVGGQVDQGRDSALVRYEPDGAVDLEVITDLSRSEAINGVAVRPDGKIVAAGFSAGADIDFAVTIFGDDGTLEHTTTTDLSNRAFGDDFADDLALLPDGGFVVVGRNTSDTFNDLALVRYDAAGGVAGDPLLVDFHGSGDVGEDVAIDADGRIVAAGHAVNGGVTEFALVRAPAG